MDSDTAVLRTLIIIINKYKCMKINLSIQTYDPTTIN